MDIHFSTGGAAFGDEYMTETEREVVRNGEVIRILKKIIVGLEVGRDCGAIMDINGNRIGRWEV